MEEALMKSVAGRPFVYITPNAFMIDRPTAKKLLQVEATPQHLRGVLSAIVDFSVTATMLAQGQMQFTPPSKSPWIAILSDDLVVGLGPEGFHTQSLNDLISEVSYAVVAATAPMRHCYNVCATVAAKHRRNALLVETEPGLAAEWVDYIRRLRPDCGILLAMPEEPRK